jgi:hypothetical protein
MRYNVGAFDMVPDPVKAAAKKVSAFLKAKGVKHALIGGMGVSAYSPPRTTADVDFLIPEADSGVAYELGEDPTPVSGMHLQGLSVNVDGIDVDLMFLPEDLPDAVLGSGPTIDGMPVLPPEAMVLLKMKAGRAKDVGDVVEMLKAGGDKKAFLKYLKRYAPDIYEDFESTIMLAEYEAAGAKDKRRASIGLLLRMRK